MIKPFNISIVFTLITISSMFAYAQNFDHATIITVGIDTLKGTRFPCKKYDSATVEINWHMLKEGMGEDASMKLLGCPDRIYQYASDSSTYCWYGKRLLIIDRGSLTLASEPYSDTVVNRNIDKVTKNMDEISVARVLRAPDRIEADPINALYYWWYDKHTIVISAIDKKVWFCMTISKASGG